MQNLNKDDTVVINTNMFHNNGAIGTVLETFQNSTRCKVLLEDGTVGVFSTDQLTKRQLLSE